MRNDPATDLSHECYVVEVDGIAKAQCRIFVKALRAGLQLEQELPNSRVKGSASKADDREAATRAESIAALARLPHFS
jgi:hypothetical protein